jgi:hypothetical protein
VNWIEGRRKSVVCEAGTSEGVLKKVQESVQSLVELNKVNLAGHVSKCWSTWGLGFQCSCEQIFGAYLVQLIKCLYD